MEIILENGNIRLEPSDWRWSAAIVGLEKYFNYHKIDFNISEDWIEFNKEDIEIDKYLYFAENFFSDNMHHKYIEDKIRQGTFDDEITKEINSKFKANVVMKNYFKDISFDKTNGDEILDRIKNNRLELIKKTFATGKALYSNFSNSEKFFLEKTTGQSGSCCRLNGYYIDMGKKSKAASFMREKKNFIFQDTDYFDFIPFAFTKTREAFYINNNSKINYLISSNKEIPGADDKNIRSKLFDKTNNASTFIDYAVEIIIKDREKDYFETLYIRKDAVKIFESMEKIGIDFFEVLKKPCKIGDGSFIDIQKEVTNCILNNLKLDILIEKLFKEENKGFLISHLIKINELIYTGGIMDFKQKKAFDCARLINNNIPSNKANSYKQKLISAVSLKDYDRVQVILIQLSAYSGIKMDFLVDLFADFEGNKNLAYTFINTLGEK